MHCSVPLVNNIFFVKKASSEELDEESKHRCDNIRKVKDQLGRTWVKSTVDC